MLSAYFRAIVLIKIAIRNELFLNADRYVGGPTWWEVPGGG